MWLTIPFWVKTAFLHCLQVKVSFKIRNAREYGSPSQQIIVHFLVLTGTYLLISMSRPIAWRTFMTLSYEFGLVKMGSLGVILTGWWLLGMWSYKSHPSLPALWCILEVLLCPLPSVCRITVFLILRGFSSSSSSWVLIGVSLLWQSWHTWFLFGNFLKHMSHSFRNWFFSKIALAILSTRSSFAPPWSASRRVFMACLSWSVCVCKKKNAHCKYIDHNITQI